jgi:hypothetical protein
MSLEMRSGRTEGGAAATEDRILYWPTVLAVLWFWCFLGPSAEPPEGQLVPGPVLIILGPVISAGVALALCIVWAYQGAWRRVLSTLILPLSLFLIGYFVGMSF